ncbi:CAP-Gly domain-containing linker protein 1 [Cocos nucifera]|uniref:CAP-Gly domain-containing linker protein 1 n=1 Tax=Cocos nucifera TaxID=13894 RepID=A0A8K0N0Y1_COCNU|nr:CAP-Gly domain-containing linker protein 1 [Cocos nucifera]
MADADLDPAPSPPAVAPLPSPPKVQFQPLGDRITELNESQSELLLKLQGLKQDLQDWRSKLDTQVKIYKDELSDLKKALNTELGQLRSEFKELRTTLQMQQDDVTLGLKNLVIQDAPEQTEEQKILKVEDGLEKPDAPSSGNSQLD